MSATTTKPSVTTIDAFLHAQHNQDLLRFITCGSVDDGKSTLIGRLLWEAQQLFDDQILALQLESKKYGTQGADIDFALLVDGLAAEREQGITIDVAYRFFATRRRKFIVADTPGHEQYTRNMITGASTADVAVLLVDARAGLLQQSRRHAFLVSLMGIRHVVLAINKMDLVNFDATRYDEIEEAFTTFTASFQFDSITTIPVSALQGDNITERSANTAWYQGPTLMGYLETVTVASPTHQKMALPIQWVNRPDANFRGFSGTLTQGRLSLGDEIRVTASGQKAVVTELVTFDEPLQTAHAGEAITVCLDKEIDASRGDILSLSQSPLTMTDQFEATLVWMHDEPGMVGRRYDLKLANQWTSATISTLKYRINVNTLNQDACKTLALNDIAVGTLATTKAIAFDQFDTSPGLGSFILVDRYNHATVAAGMIRHTLRRATNVHHQDLVVNRANRQQLNGHRGKVIWFTGLSGAGKSTLANALEIALHQHGIRTYLLDGDNLRQGLNKDLGFTDSDRIENIRRIAEVAKLMFDAGLVVMTAFISPFKDERDTARDLIGADNFFEVYVNAPLAVCEQRDTKGLYQKARQNKIPNMTGINSAYQPPENPDYEAKTANDSVASIVTALVERLDIDLNA